MIEYQAGMEWRDCPYCKKRIWSVEKVFFEHLEDCPKRPSKQSGVKSCPKCHSAMHRTTMTNPVLQGLLYICSNPDCDYQLEVIDGGQA